jgi:two-component system response regulator AtoC
MPQALLVDDDPESLLVLIEAIREGGFEVQTAQNLEEARFQLQSHAPDLILLDLHHPDGDGLDFLRNLEDRSSVEVVMITEKGTAEDALLAQQLGASSCLKKPLDPENLRRMLADVARNHQLKREILALRQELRNLARFGPLIGGSAVMQKLYDQIVKVAPTDATVLLTGESGSGKDLVARTIHEFSRRRQGPFLPVNCGAVSPNLIESELFGHEQGSFTGASQMHRGFFERATSGTLFLDEVTEMTPELQVKLLRVLETGTILRTGGDKEVRIDVRVIAATNRPPAAAVSEGRLREDLLYRLNVFPLDVPPLRERREDVELIAAAFLAELNRSEGTSKRFDQKTLDCLRLYHWPGNIRELKNVVQRAFIMAEDVITPAALPLGVESTESPARPNGGHRSRPLIEIEVGTPLADADRRLILATLELCGGNKRKTAQLLDISLRTLYNRLKTYSTQ